MSSAVSSVDFPFATVTYHGWYFHVSPREEAEFNPDNIRELWDKCILITGGKKFCVMVDANQHVKATNSGRDLAANSKYNDYIVARAVVTNSLAMKMTANFFIRFNKPVVETRLFINKEDAIDWMKKKFRTEE